MSFADKRTAQQNQPVPTLPHSVKDAMNVTQDKKQLMANRFPKALFLDLDDTILVDSDPADDCWFAVYQAFADQLAGISYQKFLAAIRERYAVRS